MTPAHVAAADRTDRHHHSCLELLETAPGPLTTTAMVVAEAVYLLTREPARAPSPRSTTRSSTEPSPSNPSSQPTGNGIRDLVDRYRNLPLGGTDTSLIAIAERLGATRIATLDRSHFSIVRPAHCDAFELIPKP